MDKSGERGQTPASAVKERPKDVRIHIRRSRALEKQGRSGEARAALIAGLRVAPKSPDLLFELVSHLIRAGRFEAAQARIRDFKNHHPNDRRLPELRAALAEAKGDLEGAELIYSADIARFPGDSKQRLRWVRCLARMGRSEEAETTLLEGLSLAAAATAEMRVELSQHLLKTGRTAEAAVHIAELARHQPDHPKLCFLQILEAETTGAFGVAADLLSAKVAANPEDEKQRLRLVRFLGRAGRQKDALDVLSEGLNLRPTSADLLARSAKLLHELRMYDAAGSAIDALRRHHPADPRLMQLLGVQAEASGEAEAALAYFATDLESAPEDATRRVRLANSMRRCGRVAEALTVLSSGTGETTGERRARVECLLETGDWDGARQILEQWPEEDEPQKRQVKAQLSVRHSLLRFDYDAALDIAQSALEISADTPWARTGVSRAAVATFQAERAWKVLLDAPRKSAGEGNAGRGFHSLVGQIVNEIRLRPAEATALRAAIVEGDDALVTTARAQIEADPGSFPAALGLLTGLARTGRLAIATVPQPDAASPHIPHMLHQFWDKEQPPEDVAKLMDGAKRINADCTYRRWCDADARRFLSTLDWAEPLRAYRVARHAAMKSDIFRLAVLCKEGGLYLDADDFCAAPLRKLLAHDTEFLCYQEEYGSIGNNFLAATPGHPIVTAALREAVRSVLNGAGESLWLVTGPGLISRIVAASIARTPDLRPSPGIQVLPLCILQRFVRPDRRVAYKKDSRHWVRAAQLPH